MKKPVILYSVQSYLAYYINTTFYNDMHYVWCAPFFDSNREAKLVPQLPYTSNPIDIYRSYLMDIKTIDNHYNKTAIQRNTVALLKGAETMHKKGNIDDASLEKIKQIINYCSIDNRINEYFRPLIYVIPYDLNKDITREVEVGTAAGALSPEYLIESLPTNNFNIIDLGDEGIK